MILRTLFILLPLSLSTVAQTTELSPLAIVEKAVAAAGGEAWARPKTLQLRGTAVFYWQGERKEELKLTRYAMWRVFPASNDAAHKANGKVRFDAFAGDKLFFQIAFDGEKSFTAYSPKAERNREAFGWENNFGFSILRFARDPGFKLDRMADDRVDGFDCYFVRVIDPKQNVTDFGIDKKDFALRYLGFKTPRGFHHRVYSDFQWVADPGFRQPTRLRIFYDGVKWMDIHWREFEVNQPIKDEVFVLKQKEQR